MSKVISLRLSYSELMGCYDLFLTSNENPKNLPVSTVIRAVVSSVLSQCREAGTIPSYSLESEAAMELKKYLPKTEWAKELLQDVEINPVVRSPNSILDTIPEVRIKRILDEAQLKAEMSIFKEDSVGMFNPPVVEHEIEEPPVMANAPWESVKLISIEAILEKRPGDPFILQSKRENDTILELAVRTIYAQLPFSAWGTELCKMQVREIYQKYLEWNPMK